jgi:hypothetical protein
MCAYCICSRAARDRIQGLPSPEERLSDFKSFIQIIIVGNGKEAVKGGFLRIYCLNFCATRLKADAGGHRLTTVRVIRSGSR